MGLPAGYKQLAYIESTGTQYIDTGFKPNNNTRVVVDAQFPSAPTGTIALFGARKAVNVDAFMVIHTGGQIRSDYNAGYAQYWSNDVTNRLVYDKNKETTTIEGTSQSYAKSTFQCDYSMFLFGLNNGGSGQWYSSMRLYSCQVYDNGTLVRDYIPCLNESGAAGLYDLANAQFYGDAAGGSFEAGPEVVGLYAPGNFAAFASADLISFSWNAVDNAVGYILRRDGLLIADTTETEYTDNTAKPYRVYTYAVSAYDDEGEGEAATLKASVKNRPILPSPYKRVEYIESTGTQYIDTGLRLNQDSKLEMLASHFNTNGNRRTFGSRSSATQNNFSVISGPVGGTMSIVADFDNYKNNRLAYVIDGDELLEISVSKEKLKINDSEKAVTTYSSFTTPGNAYLFNCSGTYPAGYTPATMRLYYCRIYDNGTLTRDFVPCCRKSDGKAGMYDLVSKRFYGDTSDGSFLAGPVIANSLIDYRTTADVERAKNLQNRIKSGKATEAELAEWLDGLIGAYNAWDMNRVESAVDYLQTYLNGVQAALDAYRAERMVASDAFWVVPWNVFSLVTKKDWVLEDIPSESDLARYLSNVDAVTNAIAIAKKLPKTMNLLDYVGANEIERALRAEYDKGMAYEHNAKRLIDNTQAAFVYSGEFYGGEF